MTVVASLLLGSCRSTAPDTTVTERVATRPLLDPRIGSPAPSKSNQRFERGWEAFLSGRLDQAEKLFAELVRRDPGYEPATLGLAAVSMERGDLEGAEALIEQAGGSQASPATRLYAAELAYLRKDLEKAYALYSEGVSSLGGEAPADAESRLAELRRELFAERFSRARSEKSDEKAVKLLRGALVLDPGSSEARALLARRLIELKRFEEARREIDPLLRGEESGSDEVQQSLAEIDAGKGKYQEAIGRYEKLARKSQDRRYSERLSELKQQWSETNMPRHYQQAMASEALTRGDLAVLIFWKVSAVRFAQRLSEPPIAIDTDIAGRDELIRSLALRLLQVDPVTRRAEPYRTISSSTFLRIASRLLSLRGTPACAAGVPPDGSEASRAARALAACGVPTDPLREGDSTVRGAVAAKVLERIDRRLSSTSSE